MTNREQFISKSTAIWVGNLVEPHEWEDAEKALNKILDISTAKIVSVEEVKTRRGDFTCVFFNVTGGDSLRMAITRLNYPDIKWTDDFYDNWILGIYDKDDLEDEESV